MSKQLGQATIEVESLGKNASGTYASLPESHGQSVNRHETGRPLLMPDEIRRMGPESVLVITQGVAPFHLRRLSYLSDPEYAGAFQANPFYS